MLEDRSPSVKSAKNAAESLMRGLNPQEQKGIQNQVAQLDRRWETVCSTSRDRLDILEEMLGLSKDFQDLHEPLTSWLDSTEKKFASLEPSAMDTQGIENSITALKVGNTSWLNQNFVSFILSVVFSLCTCTYIFFSATFRTWIEMFSLRLIKWRSWH